MLETFKFHHRQDVEKIKGYRWPGKVVSAFLTLAGQKRYVVECTVPEIAGALHIYNEEQLQASIPKDVYWGMENGNFYDARTRKGMGTEFFKLWHARRKEFPARLANDPD